MNKTIDMTSINISKFMGSVSDTEIDLMNESFGDKVKEEDPDAVNQDGSEDNFVTSGNQDDAIGLVDDVLKSYAEMDGADIVIGDIKDYDLDGMKLNSVSAKIGDNDYTFFTVDEGEVFVGLTSDFEENSVDIDTFSEWIDSDDENLQSSGTDETEDIAELVMDTIETETGDSLDYEIEEPGDDDTEEVAVPVDEAKVIVDADKNVNGKKNAKVVRKGVVDDLRQLTDKRDDSFEAYEQKNGTDQQRRNKKIIKRKAKKAGVPVNPPAPQDNGMGGGMM